MMKRRDFTLLSAGAAVSGLALAQDGPVSGRHYKTLGQALPTSAGKIEVIEFFWYGCPHCLAFEPHVEAWAKALPPDVMFRKAHVAFRANIKQHQRMFYTLEALKREAELRPVVFSAMQRDGLSLDELRTQQSFFAKHGIEAGAYEKAWSSMGVQTRMARDEKLSEDYRIDGVPSLGIGGRFLTAPSMASGGQRLAEDELGRRALQVADFLIQRIRSKA